MKDDGKSTLSGAKDIGNGKYELEIDKAGCNQEAADICPVQCIRVEK